MFDFDSASKTWMSNKIKKLDGSIVYKCNYDNCCHNELDKFLIRKSNKPKDIMKNKNILVNGLLRHEVVNPDEEQEHFTNM